ncbi:MAG: hypothetical protein QM765_06410 [Myxococcales bacterium]
MTTLRTGSALVLLVLSAALGASCQDAPKGDYASSEFWVLRDFVEAAKQPFTAYPGPNSVWGTVRVGTAVSPRGALLPLLSPPFAAAESRQSSAFDGLTVFPAYSEGAPAAYVVAEVWTDWTPMWIQPLYVPVTEWDSANPGSKRVEGALPVFSVGDRSTFYSPYWIVYWAVVGAGAKKEELTTPKAVLDRATELHWGAAKNCPIAPEGLQLAQAEGASAPVHPFTGVVAQTPRAGRAWANGHEVGYLDFGADRFEWDEGGVVEETALFALAVRDEDGEHRLLSVPRVAGVGPLRSGKPAKAPGNRPAFGSLWRLHVVYLPSSAGAFVPSTLPALRALIEGEGLRAPEIASEIEARADAADYLLRVALDPSCFADPARFPQGCQFLDSQAAVEGLLPQQAIEVEPHILNAPLVIFAGQKVPNP